MAQNAQLNQQIAQLALRRDAMVVARDKLRVVIGELTEKLDCMASTLAEAAPRTRAELEAEVGGFMAERRSKLEWAVHAESELDAKIARITAITNRRPRAV